VAITREQAEEYVGVLTRHFEGKLSEWERQFIRDMTERLEEDKPLSERQLAKIDEIMTAQARNYR